MPNIDERLGKFGEFYSDYADEVVRRIVGLVEEVLSARGEPVDFRYGEAPTAHSVNRRLWCLAPTWGIPPWKRVMARHPNPRGPRDDTLRAFAILSGQGRTSMAGVMWSFTCHPVTIADRRSVSAAYPGAIRKALRRRAGGGDPGDLSAWLRGRREAELHFAAAAVAVLPVAPHRQWSRIRQFFAVGAVRWVVSLTAAALAAATDNARPCTISGIHVRRRSCPIQQWLESPADDRSVDFHMVALDERFVLVGVSAELVVEYCRRC